MAAGGAPTTTEELRQRAQDDGIEFFFAQFVDMHGKPNAKLVPIQNFDSMMEEGAGFAGFAAGPMGQTPASPDVAAMPDPSSYTKVPLRKALARLRVQHDRGGDPWPYCPRTILTNAVDRAREARLPAEDGHRAGVLPREGTRRADRAARRPRYARPALLRHEGPDPELRVHLDALEVRRTSSAGATTRTTTRTRTASSSRTSSTTTRSSRPIARSSSATWFTRWRRSAAISRRSCRSRSRSHRQRRAPARLAVGPGREEEPLRR